MKKKWVLLLVTSCAIAAFAACSDQAAAGSGTEASTVESSAETPKPTESPQPEASSEENAT